MKSGDPSGAESHSDSDVPRQRRVKNELKNAIRAYMRARPDQTATTRELISMLEVGYSNVLPSTVRETLRDGRYFERISPGFFRLKPEEQ